MKKRDEDDIAKQDLYECRRKIKAILEEYNCQIETDSFHYCWLTDLDTDNTVEI